MKAWIVAALLGSATVAFAQGAPASGASPAKKELVARVLRLQQPGIESLARQIAQAPVLQLLQEARGIIMTQVPAEKRETVAKNIEIDARKFVDEATPMIRDRAIALAPSTVGAVMEEKFTEDELKQLAAWLESPANKKYQELGNEMQSSLAQKLMAELGPVLDPKLAALRDKMQASFGTPAPAASASRPAAPRPAAKPASK